jgi:hypothetical protein
MLDEASASITPSTHLANSASATAGTVGIQRGWRVTGPEFPRRSTSHTESLEPMAGALWTSYDASFPAMGGGNEKALQSRQQTS